MGPGPAYEFAYHKNSEVSVSMEKANAAELVTIGLGEADSLRIPTLVELAHPLKPVHIAGISGGTYPQGPDP